MRKFILTFTGIIFILGILTIPAVAQKKGANDKRTKKEWKKKAKQYVKNPLALKNNQESYQRQIEELNKKIAELSQRYTEAQADLDKCDSELKKKNTELAAMKAQYDQLNTAYEAQKKVTEKNIQPGLIFKVQLGAFKVFNINQYLKDTQNFEGESADNFNKYTIGNFRDLAIADAFKSDIRKMGIKDAWVVPYLDGVRIEMKEAKKRLGMQE
ncbi:MAG: hypothetical protein LC115_09440 [Bacteroidia bacterium]|nr:hypothetical protein [Bacteroidia bacterium]